ncbi:MAG TPA: hypothetical protein VFQ63_01790 [Patescibacteria group bacterium]|nr:hypothetical protein [Patescibacteria group bacterium]
MSDFQFIQNPLSKKWIVLAPRRSKRPDISKGENFICPFCAGQEEKEEEVYRIGGQSGDSNWEVRVLANKFPFAPVHELIIHSPEHHKNVDELPIDQVERILFAYKQRFLAHQHQGQVYIFNNHGQAGGESIPHPHTQLVVIPQEVTTDIAPRAPLEDERLETDYFYIYCPKTSEWPDEVWVAPKRKDTHFGEIENEELSDLAIILQRLIQLVDVRHGHEAPYNFYISPNTNWYFRLMPRSKSLGGFEVGTGINVNTQDPAETIRFIKSNFDNADVDEMEEENKATFAESV